MQRWLWLWLRQGRTQDPHWENVRVFPVYDFPACATWNVSLYRDKGCSRDTSCLCMPCAPAPCQGKLQGGKELERVTPSGGHKHPQSSWVMLSSPNSVPLLRGCGSGLSWSSHPDRIWLTGEKILPSPPCPPGSASQLATGV